MTELGRASLMGHVSPAAEKEISGALLEVVGAARRLCSQIGGVRPRAQSDLATWFGGSELASTPVSSVYPQLAVAIDAARAFSKLLRLDEDFGPSLATLVRAHLEALGIAWWLLQSRDGAQLTARAAELKLQQFTSSAMLVETRDANGELVDADAELLKLKQAASQAAIPGERNTPPNRSASVETLVRAAGEPRADVEYRVLSGIAHGSTYMVEGLGRLVDGAGEGNLGLVLGLPQRYAELYTWDLVATLDIVVTRLCELAGLDDELERWNVVQERSRERIRDVFNATRSDEGLPPLI